MRKAKDLSGAYIDALSIFNDTKVTKPTGRGANAKPLKQWESVMTNLRSNARQRWVDYVVALLHEESFSHGELETFDVDTRLSMCLEPEALAKLIEDAIELGESGYRWTEEAVSREMAIQSTLPLRAQAVNLGGVIDLVVVPCISDRKANVDRLIKEKSRV